MKVQNYKYSLKSWIKVKMQLYYSKISLIVLVRAVRQNGTLLGRASRRLSACFCKLKMIYAIEFSFYFKLLLSLFLFEKAFAAIALLQTVELFSRWRWTNGSAQKSPKKKTQRFLLKKQLLQNSSKNLPKFVSKAFQK